MVIKRLKHEDVLSFIPDRKIDAHKGDFGKILLICGSRGYTGAPALAALGALRTGAGLVYLAVPESIYQIEAIKLLEPIVLSLTDNNGSVSTDATDSILQLLKGKSAVLIGPGLGVSEGSAAAVQLVLEQYAGPVILDADGINVIAKHKDVLRGRKGITILTPHFGEFMRLTETMNTDRIQAAASLAVDLDAIVLLKGHQTVITDGQTCFVNDTGNPGMAVGGCGDVLSGMIVSLIGQGLPPLEATACAAWLHGAAGDLCAAQLGQYAMLPGDMLNVLPRLLK